MTYLDYIIHFQRFRQQYPLPSVAADLYYHLLWTANNLRWKNPFQEGNPMIMASLGMADKTLMSAREKLVTAGLIKFTPGKKGTYSTYELLAHENNTENLRGIREQSSENNTENLRGIREQSEHITPEKGVKSPAIYRVDKRREDKEAKASASAEKKSASTIPIGLSPPEPWAVWLAENAPTVQRLKSPLTAKQWDKLVADFTEPIVQQVLLAMENKADLLKRYTSANLTAREWCGRRQPERRVPPPPPAGLATSVEPELNPEVVAERQRQRDEEAAANRRRIRKNNTDSDAS